MSGLGWEGSGGSGGGVTSLALDAAGTEPALSGSTGAVTISIPEADSLVTGVVNHTGTQYFGGNKVFLGQVSFNNIVLSDAGGFLLMRATGVVYEKGAGLVIDTGLATLDCQTANVFTVTPNQDFTINAVNIRAAAFQDVRLIVYTSGTTSYTITFGTNIRATGNLITGVLSDNVFQLVFTADGTDLIEASRTVAIA